MSTIVSAEPCSLTLERSPITCLVVGCRCIGCTATVIDSGAVAIIEVLTGGLVQLLLLLATAATAHHGLTHAAAHTLRFELKGFELSVCQERVSDCEWQENDHHNTKPKHGAAWYSNLLNSPLSRKSNRIEVHEEVNNGVEHVKHEAAVLVAACGTTQDQGRHH